MMLFWPDAMQSLQIMMPMMILMRKLSKPPRSILKTGTAFTLEQVHSAPYRHCLINDYITSYKAIYILITKLVIVWRRPTGFTLTFSCGLKLSYSWSMVIWDLHVEIISYLVKCGEKICKKKKGIINIKFRSTRGMLEALATYRDLDT